MAIYNEKMISNPSTNFLDIVIVVEKVERGIKVGKIIDATVENSALKKNVVIKEKEREVYQVEAKMESNFQPRQPSYF